MDKYISNKDLEDFTRYLGDFDNFLFFEEDIGNGISIDDLFNGDNYFAILFKKNPHSEIGHWTCMIKWDDYQYEYFDCLAEPPAQNILNSVMIKGGTLEVLTKPLMHHEGIICGKWVISRISSIPTSLKEYTKFFKSISKKYSPDSVINLLFNLPSKL